MKATHRAPLARRCARMCSVGVTILAYASGLGRAPAATLSGTLDLLPTGALANLTAEGTLDWMHWGCVWQYQIDRKYGCPQQLQSVSLTSSQWDGPYWVGTSINQFFWTDGTPTTAVPETGAGIGYVGLNHGIQITCPSGITRKRLKLYVGITQARAAITATLSGSGLPGYTNTAFATASGDLNAVVTLDFQAASPRQTLTVTVTLRELLGADSYLKVYAATLSGEDALPTVHLSAPLNGAVYPAPATLSLSATSSVATGSITNLELFRNAIRIGQTNGRTFQMTLSNMGTNTYVFTARATDTHGMAVTSMPVTVYVTTGGGWLQGRMTLPATRIDLTATSRFDWAHWGLSSASSFNRKAGVVAVLADVVPVGVQANRVSRYTDNRTGFTWSDGTPVPAATDTTTGLFVIGQHNGFQLTVPASPTPRQLRLYVGLYGAQGRLEAWLSDGSGAPFRSTELQRAYNNAYAVYTLLYASRSASASLVVRWTAEVLYDSQYGNVTWQAATVSPLPAFTCGPNRTVGCDDAWDFAPPIASDFCSEPTVAILSTVTNTLCGCSYVATRTWQVADECGNAATCAQTVQVDELGPPRLMFFEPRPPATFGFRFCTQRGRTYTVLYTSSLAAARWQVATKLAGTGSEEVILHSQLGSAQRFYRLQVE